MKAYGIGRYNGKYACGCCGGVSMKHSEDKTLVQKNMLRLAKKKGRREGKQEVKEQLTTLNQKEI